MDLDERFRRLDKLLKEYPIQESRWYFYPRKKEKEKEKENENYSRDRN